MWALTRRGGRSTGNDLLGDPTLVGLLRGNRRGPTEMASRFQTLISEVGDHPQVMDAISQDRLDQLMQDCLDSRKPSEESLLKRRFFCPAIGVHFIPPSPPTAKPVAHPV